MGTSIALREKCPVVPGTPGTRSELSDEIRKLSKNLAVEDVLRGWAYAVQKLTTADAPIGAVQFLLQLDSSTKQLTISPFKMEELQRASEMYLTLEKETKDRPEIQVVLVSVDSIEALPAAYPNYYLDTGAFIEAVKLATK